MICFLLYYSHFQIHRQNKAEKAVVGELHQSTLVCDRKNSRGPKGQSLPKRTKYKQSNKNSVSIFLVCGIGESQHEGHRPRNAVDMATRKHIVPAAATNFQKMSANHNIGPGKPAAMVEQEFGLHLTRRQVAQMQQMAKLADDLTSTDELEEYNHLDSDTDRILAYLKKKGASYGALYHGVGGSSPELVPRTQKKSRTEVGACDVADLGQLIWTERMDHFGNQGDVQCEVLPDDEVFLLVIYSIVVPASAENRHYIIHHSTNTLLSSVEGRESLRRLHQSQRQTVATESVGDTPLKGENDRGESIRSSEKETEEDRIPALLSKEESIDSSSSSRNSGSKTALSIVVVAVVAALVVVFVGLVIYRKHEIERWNEYRTHQLLAAQDEAFDLSCLTEEEDGWDMELSIH
ncbi:hypothetical protein IV203_035142 [Nitzschia inconspicua]|uniref:Uncharacterized protein n=1 Tax=Nitzschia inconspicua TaxID=303405 RepID=A0A9K3PWV0_9STRA|nr:hypothetical protein IV203_035142 [Nitzschia inconspicua]